jgi:hypothetical protein
MWYKLDKENNPVICVDMADYAEWLENNKNQKVVKQENIDDILVSTVFLGLDHSFSTPWNNPILWETMIFGGEFDQYQDRYSSYEDALKGHEKAMKLVSKNTEIK